MHYNNTEIEKEEKIPTIGAINPPQIAHVYIKISPEKYDQKLTVKALHDSGCAKSIIHLNIFKKIPNYKNITLTPLPNIYISSCTGERTNVVGFVTLCLTFEGENNNRLSFYHDVLVHDNLEHDFLLGRDFTGSPAKVLETNSHIFLSNIIENISFEDTWERQKRNYVDVPIISRLTHTHAVNSNKESWIPPHSLVGITGHLIQNNYIPILGKAKNDTASFEISNLLQPILKHPDALLTYNDPTEIIIPVYNPTSEDIFVAANVPLAKIKFWEGNTPIYNLQMNSDDSTCYQTNNVNINIDKDDFLTEEEKNDAFQEYLETGRFTMPMSSYIEKSPSVTEMSLRDVTPITEKEFEKQFDLKHLPIFAQKHAKRIFHKNKTVFSKHEMDLGCSKNVEMDIEIDKTKPRIQKYYPLPYAVRDGVRKILDQMLEFNIIRECPEPSLFVSNLLVTKKKNGDYRILLDGRLLNNAMIRKATTLVAPLEIFAALAQKNYVSIFDVSNAFFQIPIKFEDQPLTAFYSEAHGKRYCYTRAPQGLKNSPLYLKLLMDRMLGPLSKYVIHYADDVMIATDGSLAHHIDIIGKVLKQFKRENIKIRPQKMEIAKPQIEFLGVLWKQGTLNIPRARVQAFMDMKKPNTPKKVKSFVCAMSYYRRFIPKFADLAKPLMDISNVHPKQFKWLQIHEDAFNNMLEAIKLNTSLNLPDPQKTFYVQTDASDVAGAGRIFQKDEEGNEKLLACVSRTFTKAERKYGVFRKEVLALLYCLKSMDFFLRFAPKLVFLIDAKSIIFLRLCKESAGILLRFSLELSKYEAEIHHIPGAKNEISDLMSRAHKDIESIITENKQKNILSEKQSSAILDRLTIPSGQIFTPEEVACLLEMDSLPGPPTKRKKPESKSKFGLRHIKNTPQTMGERNVKLPPTSHRRPGVILPKKEKTCDINCYNNSIGIICTHTRISYSEFGNLSRIILPGNITKQLFAEIQEEDPTWRAIMEKTILPAGYKKIEGMLFKIKKEKHRLCLPSSLIDAVIISKHFTVMGLHFSKSRIRRDIMSRYFCHLPTLNRKLKEIVKTCIQCQFNASSPEAQLFRPMDIVFAPRVSWAVDIIPSLTPSKRGNNAIFLAVDMFTGYIQLQAIKSRQASEMIEAVKNTILVPFGIPKYFRCDNESGMANSAEFLKFMEPLKINFMPCSTGSPWSNGAAERAVQTIKKAIRHFITQEKSQEKWDDYIHFFTMAHNKSANVYNYSPEELHFGILNPPTTELIELWPQFSDRDEYMDKIVPRAAEARKIARERALEKTKRVMTYRNQNRREKTFNPGQIVIHRQLQVSTGQGGALKPLFTGPYVIESIDKDNSSATLEHMHTKQPMQAHFTNIQLLQYDPGTARLPSEFDENLNQFLPEKDSLRKYHPRAVQKRRELNERRRERDSQGSSDSNDSQTQWLNTRPPQRNSFTSENFNQISHSHSQNPFHSFSQESNTSPQRNRELATPYYRTDNPSKDSERLSEFDNDVNDNDFDFNDPNFDPLSSQDRDFDEDDNIPKITTKDGKITIKDPQNIFGHKKQDGSYDFTGLTIKDPHNVLGLGRGTTRLGSQIQNANEHELHTQQSQDKTTLSHETNNNQQISTQELNPDYNFGQIRNDTQAENMEIIKPYIPDETQTSFTQEREQLNNEKTEQDLLHFEVEDEFHPEIDDKTPTEKDLLHSHVVDEFYSENVDNTQSQLPQSRNFLNEKQKKLNRTAKQRTHKMKLRAKTSSQLNNDKKEEETRIQQPQIRVPQILKLKHKTSADKLRHRDKQ